MTTHCTWYDNIWGTQWSNWVGGNRRILETVSSSSPTWSIFRIYFQLFAGSGFAIQFILEHTHVSRTDPRPRNDNNCWSRAVANHKWNVCTWNGVIVRFDDPDFVCNIKFFTHWRDKETSYYQPDDSLPVAVDGIMSGVKAELGSNRECSQNSE